MSPTKARKTLVELAWPAKYQWLQTEEKLTALDDALRIARESPAHANFFYDAFLNSNLFIPAQREDKQEGEWKQIKATERFFPLYLRQGETKAVPVFDTLEKMQTWAGERAFDYLLLPTLLFLKVIASDVGLLLNESTPWRYQFTVEILEQLRSAARPVLQ